MVDSSQNAQATLQHAYTEKDIHRLLRFGNIVDNPQHVKAKQCRNVQLKQHVHEGQEARALMRLTLSAICPERCQKRTGTRPRESASPGRSCRSERGTPCRSGTAPPRPPPRAA